MCRYSFIVFCVVCAFKHMYSLQSIHTHTRTREHMNTTMRGRVGCCWSRAVVQSSTTHLLGMAKSAARLEQLHTHTYTTYLYAFTGRLCPMYTCASSVYKCAHTQREGRAAQAAHTVHRAGIVHFMCSPTLICVCARRNTRKHRIHLSMHERRADT